MSGMPSNDAPRPNVPVALARYTASCQMLLLGPVPEPIARLRQDLDFALTNNLIVDVATNSTAEARPVDPSHLNWRAFSIKNVSWRHVPIHPYSSHRMRAVVFPAIDAAECNVTPLRILRRHRHRPNVNYFARVTPRAGQLKLSRFIERCTNPHPPLANPQSPGLTSQADNQTCAHGDRKQDAPGSAGVHLILPGICAVSARVAIACPSDPLGCFDSQ